MERSRVFRHVATLSMLMALLIGRGEAGQTHHKPRPKRHYPVTLAGIEAGNSTDENVVAKFGKGYFVEDEGHLGGRYYVDAKHSVMLHVEIGVDHVIETIEYQYGVELPNKKAKTLKQATTTRLNASLKLAKGVGLGATAQNVVRAYGRPTRDLKDGKSHVITYASNAISADPAREVMFQCEGERVIYISLHDGEGD